MQTGNYTGIGLIGNEDIAAIYAVNNGIVDINGTGIYHLFYKDYSHDLLQSAVTMIKAGNGIFYGNKIWHEYTHPHHIRPQRTYVEGHYRYCDEFNLEEIGLKRKDTVYAYGKNRLVFETEIENIGDEMQEISCYGYAALRNTRKIAVEELPGGGRAVHTGNVYMGMDTPVSEEVYMIEDSPTDFAYQTFLDVLEGKQDGSLRVTDCRLGYVQGGRRTGAPGETKKRVWALVFADSAQELEQELRISAGEDKRAAADSYWDKWFREGKIPETRDEFAAQALTNLAAIKAVCVRGYIPADLTGHYFYDKMPCYYARDSIMIARAFLAAGHTRECGDILGYLTGRKRKKNGEFFQRYDGHGEPNEGANNDVFHQIDSIGYFLRMLYEYMEQTGELLADETLMSELVDVIDQAESKYGMAGPEGGVNEGVFGGAFITSSNMFIYGGIRAAGKIFLKLGNKAYEQKCKEICGRLYAGIQTTFNEKLGRYDYGYVQYHDHTVRKYDTPQYFGPLYGYPDDENMKATHRYFLKYASFFEDGIGYSEQEYHHGPWLFNTLACAEYCKRSGDMEEYRKKMSWAARHSNAYGIFPEAVDADDEEVCMINPLSWACAEFAAAYFGEGGFDSEE